MATSHDPHAHGSHHVLQAPMLLRTIGALVVLTILTVVLGLMERSGALHLGVLAVPVALLIAGAKATLVALFFMGLRYDGGSNAIAFVMGIVFLAVFVTFTFLDTGTRDRDFDERVAVPIDQLEAQNERSRQTLEAIRPEYQAQPTLAAPDSLLLNR